MSLNPNSFKEELLHQVWAKQIFAHRALQTTNDETVEVIHPGRLNHIDGPDFLEAKIRIGALIHNGAVEIHRNSKDWYAHGHHKDEKYDNVILHVVSEIENIIQVTTKKGFKPQTLNIFHQLPTNIQSFAVDKDFDELPCSPLVKFLSADILETQIEKAHQEYLEQKVGVFFQFYDVHENPSDAWKNALFITLCDALGVPSNRDSMKSAAFRIIKEINQNSTLDELNHKYLIQEIETSLNWNRKRTRRVTQPKYRIWQAIKLYCFIKSKPLEYFFNPKLHTVWFDILSAIGLKNTRHNHRLYVSFLLPALYGLSTMVHSERLKSTVVEAWNSSEVEVPNSIMRKFGVFEAHVNSNTMKRIGLVHQFNAYCKPKCCIKCEVLNKAISS